MELLPCPFCGGNASITTKGNAYTPKRSATIKCDYCRFHVTNAAVHYDLDFCISACKSDWNTRAPNQAVLELTKALQYIDVWCSKLPSGDYKVPRAGIDLVRDTLAKYGAKESN